MLASDKLAFGPIYDIICSLHSFHDRLPSIHLPNPCYSLPLRHHLFISVKYFCHSPYPRLLPGEILSLPTLFPYQFVSFILCFSLPTSNPVTIFFLNCPMLTLPYHQWTFFYIPLPFDFLCVLEKIMQQKQMGGQSLILPYPG